MAQYLYARDVITINSALDAVIQAETGAKHLSPGDTIVLAARVCMQDPTYTWKPARFNVVVAADQYVFSSPPAPSTIPGPGIAPSGLTGTQGTAGATGSRGVAKAANPVPGGPGAPGGPGGPGGPANSITVLAQTLDPVNLSATGGVGGRGGAGGTGGTGAPEGTGGTVAHPIDLLPSPGGAGGSGGTVTVVYVSAGYNVAQFGAHSAPGGAGGAGGPAGAGGYSPDFGNGPNGNQGPAGQTGAAGHVSVSEVAQSVYWSTVINTFGAGSATLARSFYFRQTHTIDTMEKISAGRSRLLATAWSDRQRAGGRLGPGSASAWRPA